MLTLTISYWRIRGVGGLGPVGRKFCSAVDSDSLAVDLPFRLDPHSQLVLQRVRACINLYKGGERVQDFYKNSNASNWRCLDRDTFRTWKPTSSG